MAIADYLDEKLIVFLKAEGRDAAIAELVHIAHTHGKVDDAAVFEEAVLHRENIVSTGIGMGVAVPHAKLPTCKEFFIVIGIQKGKALSWEALDGAPVSLIFLIGGPPDRQTEYLKILSQLTACIKDSEFRRRLLAVKSAEKALETIHSFL